MTLEMRPLIRTGGVSSLDLCAQVWEEEKKRELGCHAGGLLCGVKPASATLGIMLPKQLNVQKVDLG